jgi:hypothetical protein
MKHEMSRFVIAAATAALLSGAGITSVQAQEAQGTTEEEIIKKKPGAATEAAPGQQQKSGEVDKATEAAPGQQQKTGETDAQDVAPGQVKKQATGEQPEEQNSGQAGAATEAAPGQQQKSGAADSAQEVAPGQQQKTGEADAQDAAPGQQKTGEAEAQPSGETTASIDITTEQRTEITQIFRSEKAEPVDVDIDVSVGVVVPRTVTLRPLPPRVIEIVPAYRGYEYFVLADGRIIIVEPGTLKVVYILVV